MRRFILVVVAINSFLILRNAWADEAQADILPSPYFIDGVHCDGLGDSRRVNGWLQLGRLHKDDQMATAKRVASQEDCEEMLDVFGLKKFSWLTPEDLEKLSDSLKRSGYFATADVTIKKSETKNHIHLFVVVKRNVTSRFYLSDEFTYFPGKDNDSARTINHFQFEYRDRHDTPMKANYYGLIVENSSAASQMAGADPALFSANQYPFLADLYMGGNRHLLGDSYLNWDVHLASVNSVTDRGTFFGTGYGTIDWKFPTRVAFLSGETYIAPGVLLTSEIMAPGGRVGWLYGSTDSNFFRLDLAYYYSPKAPTLLLDHALTLRYAFKQVPSLGDFYLDIKLMTRLYDNSIIPLDTYPYQKKDLTIEEINLGKHVNLLGVPSEITWKLGGKTIKDRDSRVELTSTYTGLGLIVHGEALDVQINATYGFNRTF